MGTVWTPICLLLFRYYNIYCYQHNSVMVNFFVFQGQFEEGIWLTQVLREQIELLEIILLYYKDFDFLAPDLCQAAKRFQVYYI